MESLLLAAQQQQLRQLRKLQQIRRQAELAAALEAEGNEKLRAEEEKRAALEAGVWRLCCARGRADAGSACCRCWSSVLASVWT